MESENNQSNQQYMQSRIVQGAVATVIFITGTLISAYISNSYFGPNSDARIREKQLNQIVATQQRITQNLDRLQNQMHGKINRDVAIEKLGRLEDRIESNDRDIQRLQKYYYNRDAYYFGDGFGALYAVQHPSPVPPPNRDEPSRYAINKRLVSDWELGAL